MIHFVGAGPGDVDLITVKGRRLMEGADVVIYAGSLVSEEHLAVCREDAQFYNSAKMTLDEVLSVMREAEAKGLDTVRLHTGDPSIYGAIQEQMDALKEDGIAFEVVPGVSSFTAAAAAIEHEFTLPGVSQTVIITRRAGRTPVPGRENITDLARHGASMAIFLSVGSLAELTEELAEGYGSWDVPIAVIYRATWPDEKRVLGTLRDITQKVRDEKIVKQAQILVGPFLDSAYDLSKLYDPSFTTEYRQGTE
ncbi:MAG: precorrin-4 C(11)-methyltransferase [Tissierellia bacterium]|nr:precorrin-4 C(11)-methyltransferase [Tissierellia bacterium]